MKLGGGNVFTPVCQSFCPLGVCIPACTWAGEGRVWVSRGRGGGGYPDKGGVECILLLMDFHYLVGHECNFVYNENH